MVLRVSAPGKPTKLIDLGPAIGVRHPWRLMRRTVDDAPKDGSWAEQTATRADQR